jgi:hypothetical protein
MQKNKKNNDWLIDRNFILQIEFKNKMYLNRLFQKIFDLLKEFPIPIVASYDFKGQQIYFMFIDNKKSFVVDEDIDIDDYITLVKRWAKPFFPFYTVSTKETVCLGRDEIFKKIKEDRIPVEDALFLTKKVDIVEHGVITSVYLSEDWFKIYINDIPSIRKTNKMLRKDFLHVLKDIKDDSDRKSFIMNNSVELIEDQDREYVYSVANYFQEPSLKTIRFEGQKMINFFSINYPDLKKDSIDIIADSTYTWGRFTIVFADEETETYCLEYVWQKRNRDGINFNQI